MPRFLRPHLLLGLTTLAVLAASAISEVRGTSCGIGAIQWQAVAPVHILSAAAFPIGALLFLHVFIGVTQFAFSAQDTTQSLNALGVSVLSALGGLILLLGTVTDDACSSIVHSGRFSGAEVLSFPLVVLIALWSGASFLGALVRPPSERSNSDG